MSHLVRLRELKSADVPRSAQTKKRYRDWETGLIVTGKLVDREDNLEVRVVPLVRH